MGGQPVVSGTRSPAATILAYLQDGYSASDTRGLSIAAGRRDRCRLTAGIPAHRLTNSQRLVIDECLSIALAAHAHRRGYAADHVAHVGLAGRSDRELVRVILSGDDAFATNNRTDFRKLHGDETLQNRLIVIVPNVSRHERIDLPGTALDHLEALPDLVNKVLEVAGDKTITVSPLARSC